MKPVAKPKALVLCGLGQNCEFETAHALALGGAAPEIVHFNDLLSGKHDLEDYQAFALPGGFSFGDDIQSGRVLANKFRYKLSSKFRKFVDDGKPVVGICNGFQTLVQLGALPGWDDWSRRLALMRNASGKFEDRWIKMRTEASACTFAQGCEYIFAPVRHGEGQVAFRESRDMQRLIDNRQVVFRYASLSDGMAATCYPDNPNGSADAISGICNEAGNVLGLMPHPECHVRKFQSPHWAAQPKTPKPKKEGIGGFLSSVRTSLFGSSAESQIGTGLPLFIGIANSAKKYI